LIYHHRIHTVLQSRNVDDFDDNFFDDDEDDGQFFEDGDDEE